MRNWRSILKSAYCHMGTMKDKNEDYVWSVNQIVDGKISSDGIKSKFQLRREEIENPCSHSKRSEFRQRKPFKYEKAYTEDGGFKEQTHQEKRPSEAGLGKIVRGLGMDERLVERRKDTALKRLYARLPEELMELGTTAEIGTITEDEKQLKDL